MTATQKECTGGEKKQKKADVKKWQSIYRTELNLMQKAHARATSQVP